MPPRPHEERAVLNVYYLGTTGTTSQWLEKVGAGAYHTGVEVFGTEYTYGGTDDAVTGIEQNAPRENSQHTFKESIDLGTTSKSKQEIETIIRLMEHDWMGPDYHLIRKNCVIFCDEFIKKLGLAGVPASVFDLCSKAQRVSGTAHALGQKYDVEDLVSNIEDFIVKGNFFSNSSSSNKRNP